MPDSLPSPGLYADHFRKFPAMIGYDHPLRGRINAWLLLALDGYMHRKYAARKAAWFRDTAGIAAEIGPGTGANLRYVGRELRLIAIEPNPRMHEHLMRRARDLGIDLELVEASAEAMGLPDASVDLVFCSLVLCTVQRPEAVLSEVLRVLKPGGRFACIEHVCAPHGSGIHRLQQALERPWRWLFEGCHLCRDTTAMLQEAGFSAVHVAKFRLDTAILPIAYQIEAICHR